MMDSDIIKSAEILNLKPGDVVVFKIDETVSMQAARNIRELIKQFFAKHGIKAKPMIFSGNLDISILREED